MAEQVELRGTVLSTRRISNQWGEVMLDTSRRRDTRHL